MNINQCEGDSCNLIDNIENNTGGQKPGTNNAEQGNFHPKSKKNKNIAFEVIFFIITISLITIGFAVVCYFIRHDKKKKKKSKDGSDSEESDEDLDGIPEENEEDYQNRTQENIEEENIKQNIFIKER